MLRNYCICICIAILSFLSSCKEKVVYPAAMRQAIACMNSYPDSARFYLLSLPDSILAGETEEVRMYYALLSIKAADKLYQVHTSDSLIRTIVNYYEKHPNCDKLMEAYFYLGSTYRDMKDAPRALKAYQQALDTGEGSDNYTLLGMTCGQMATLYLYQNLYEEALEAQKMALVYYKQHYDIKRISLAYRNIAHIYNALKQRDMAKHYYKEAYHLALNCGDEKVTHLIMGEMGCLFYRIGQKDTAKMMLLQANSKRMFSNVILHLGLVYRDEGKLDSARYYFHEAIKIGNIYKHSSALRFLSELEADKKNYHQAYNYLKKTHELYDSIDHTTLTEATKRVQSLYNYQHTESRNRELAVKNANYRQLLFLSVLLVVIVLFIALYIIYRIREKRQKAIERERQLRFIKEEQYIRSLSYIEENNQKLAMLTQKLQETEINNDILNKQLLLSQKAALEQANRQNIATRSRRELLEATFHQSDVYIRFHKPDVKISDEDWKELQEAIDATYPFFTIKLYNLYPRLSQQELRICYLIRISLPNKDIATLLNRTPSAITKARVRLYAKIYGKDAKEGDISQIVLDL